MATQQKTDERSRTPENRGQGQESRGIQRRQGGAFDRAFGLGPFSLMRRIVQDDLDRWMGLASRSRGSVSSVPEQADWIPTVEAFNRGNEFVVRAELPGLSPDDVEVDVEEDAITIRGERKYEHEEEREGVYVSERSYGSFVRTVPLPQGAIADNAKAEFRNGVLEIVVPAPSREASRGRRLEIKSESKDQQPRS